mmetsp:Transcript_97870/g.204082  ORF Transcript_97870/g.204082 Transcript_97870/m.204082 type:complete len:83 (+) Transcript_97870:2177-2425(+)
MIEVAALGATEQFENKYLSVFLSSALCSFQRISQRSIYLPSQVLALVCRRHPLLFIARTFLLLLLTAQQKDGPKIGGKFFTS